MSESRNDRIREAVNIIESAEGARDRMLANIKRKAAEQAAGEDTYSTPALEKNIPFKRFVKWLIPIAACFVIVVIGTAERQKTNNTTDPLSATTNPFTGVDNTVEPEPVYAEIIPRSVEECVNDIPNIVQGECLQVTPHQNGVNCVVVLKPEAVYQGDLSGAELQFVTVYPDFKPGDRYIIFASQSESAYTQTVTNVVEYSIRLSGAELEGKGIEGLHDLKEKELIELISTCVKKNENKDFGPISGAYIKSTDLDEIAAETPYIFEVEVLNFTYPPTTTDRVWAECRVLQTWKGKNETEIKAVLPAEGIQVNGKYILMLTKYSEDTSLFYFISSPQSVIPADSPEAEKIRGAW